MCRLQKVSASGYYAWRTRPESPRAKLDRELVSEIKRIHAQRKGVYGSPRIRAELASEGRHVGRNKVARLMRLERLRGCPNRRFRVTTKRDPSHAVAKNLLQQHPTNVGWPTLPISQPIRAVFIWPLYWIYTRDESWVGR